MPLTDPIPAGESRDLTRDWYNELVEILRRKDVPSPFTIGASTHYVEVHYDTTSSEGDDDFPLSPEAVSVRDETDWHGFDPSKIRIQYALEGLGHLSSDEAAAGEEVQWSWGLGDTPPRDWDADVNGESLPSSATVVATAEILTEETTRPSVQLAAHLDDFSGVQIGERCYVRTEDQVYRFDGAEWVAVDGETWVPFGRDEINIVVARAFHPELLSELNLTLVPEASLISLSPEGLAQLRVHDLSRFPADSSDHQRLVEVYWADENGVMESDKGITYTLADDEEGPTADIDITVRSVGNAIVKATYSMSTPAGRHEYTVTRRIRVTSPVARHLPAIAPPSLPSAINVDAQDGQCVIDLGIDVEVTSITQVTAEAREVASFIEPMQHVANTLASRLADAPANVLSEGLRDELTAGQPLGSTAESRFLPRGQENERDRDDLLTREDALQLLNSSRTVIESVSSGTAQTVHQYKVELIARGKHKDVELTDIEPGQILHFVADEKPVQLRVLQLEGGLQAVTTDENGNSVDGITIYAEGLVPRDSRETQTTYSGHVTGAGDHIAVRAEFAYGDRTGTGAPAHTRMTKYFLLDPTTGKPSVTTRLPQAQPRTAQDGWYVRMDVASIWNGQVYKMAEGEEWVRAEVVPDDAIVAQISTGSSPLSYILSFRGYTTNQAGDTVPSGRDPKVVSSYADVDGDASVGPLHPNVQFFGYYDWQLQGGGLGELNADRIVDQTTPLDNQIITRPVETADLKIHGHLRSQGGTCSPNIVTITKQSVDPAPGSTMRLAISGDYPTIPAPDISGVFLRDTTDTDDDGEPDEKRAWVSVKGEWFRVGGAGGAQTIDTQPPLLTNYEITGTNQSLTFNDPNLSVTLLEEDIGETVHFVLEFQDSSEITQISLPSGSDALNENITQTATGRRLEFDWEVPQTSTTTTHRLAIQTQDSLSNTKTYYLNIEQLITSAATGITLEALTVDGQDATGSGSSRTATLAPDAGQVEILFDYASVSGVSELRLTSQPQTGVLGAIANTNDGTYTITFDTTNHIGQDVNFSVRAADNDNNMLTASLNLSVDAPDNIPTDINIQQPTSGSQIATSSDGELPVEIKVKNGEGAFIVSEHLALDVYLYDSSGSKPSNPTRTLTTGGNSDTYTTTVSVPPPDARTIEVVARDTRPNSNTEARYQESSSTTTFSTKLAQVAPTLSHSGLDGFEELLQAEAYVTASDPNGDDITGLTVSGLPSGLQTEHQYKDGNGNWVVGERSYPDRRLRIYGIPDLGTSGDHEITVTATDGVTPNEITPTLSVAATPDSEGPSITESLSNDTWQLIEYDGTRTGGRPSYTWVVDDPSTLPTVDVQNLPSGFDVDKSGTGTSTQREVTITGPNELGSGNYNFTLYAEDGANNSTAKEFDIAVTSHPGGTYTSNSSPTIYAVTGTEVWVDISGQGQPLKSVNGGDNYIRNIKIVNPDQNSIQTWGTYVEPRDQNGDPTRGRFRISVPQGFDARPQSYDVEFDILTENKSVKKQMSLEAWGGPNPVNDPQDLQQSWSQPYYVLNFSPGSGPVPDQYIVTIQYYNYSEPNVLTFPGREEDGSPKTMFYADAREYSDNGSEYWKNTFTVTPIYNINGVDVAGPPGYEYNVVKY